MHKGERVDLAFALGDLVEVTEGPYRRVRFRIAGVEPSSPSGVSDQYLYCWKLVWGMEHWFGRGELVLVRPSGQ